MIIHRGFKYRIYPTPEQEARLRQWERTLRFLWNLGLEQWHLWMHGAVPRRFRGERAFLKALSGGCRVPVGVRTRVSGGRFHMEGAVFSVKNAGWVRSRVEVALSKAVPAAQKLARTLLKNGGAAFLKEARS